MKLFLIFFFFKFQSDYDRKSSNFCQWKNRKFIVLLLPFIIFKGDCFDLPPIPRNCKVSITGIKEISFCNEKIHGRRMNLLTI